MKQPQQLICANPQRARLSRDRYSSTFDTGRGQTSFAVKKLRYIAALANWETGENHDGDIDLQMGYIVSSMSPDVESFFYRHGIVSLKARSILLWIASYQLTTALALTNPLEPFLHGGLGGFYHKLCVQSIFNGTNVKMD